MSKYSYNLYLISEIESFKNFINDSDLMEFVQRRLDIINTKYNNIKPLKIFGITIMNAEERRLSKMNRELEKLLNIITKFHFGEEIGIV